jgi:hypothetical protein
MAGQRTLARGRVSRFAVGMAKWWVVAVLASGCTALPPTGWNTGGAELVIPRARWVYGDVAIELDHDGHVYVLGEHVLTVDRAGRAYDARNVPVGLLRPDGYLLGPDDERLGWVGAGQATTAEGEPWLFVLPSGEVKRIVDGVERPFGVWLGCQAPTTVQACTLVTHIVGLELLARQREPEPGIGFGLGIGVGVGVGP